MSTLPSQARVSPHWKEEVNQRLAAHKNRKPAPLAGQDLSAQEHHASSARAAAAAARVAERFAKQPRYSESLENEARAAVRAAEAISRAALEAQAVAESVLADVQAAKAAEPAWQFGEIEEPVPANYEETPVSGPSIEDLENQPAGHGPSKLEEQDRQENESASYQVQWESDAPMSHAASYPAAANVDSPIRQADTRFELEECIEIAEAAQPIHANLIQFPREIVATRKARPRRAEGPFAAQTEPGSQLSIFEVDPEAISTDPAGAEALNPTAVPTWMAPEWYGMELDRRPEEQFRVREEAEFNQREVPVTIVDHRVEQAPLSIRLMAAMVDGSLVLAAFLAVTWEIVSRLHTLPAKRPAEMLAAFGLMMSSLLYLALFAWLCTGTPGMRYAGIVLSTFEGRVPTREDRVQRCVALLVSVLPVGVGVLWSVFDESHLSWHDRLSRTYLRLN